MKTKLTIILSLALIMLVSACKSEEGVGEDVIFMTGTLESPTVKFNVDGASSVMGVTVTSTDKVAQDMNVKLQVDPTALAVYNDKNGRSYEVPPTEAYELENTDVTIKAGQYVSTQAKLVMKDPDKLKEGVKYCIPVSIVSTDGAQGILESSKTAFIVIDQIITTKAVDMQGYNYFTVPSFLAKNVDTSKDVSNLRQLTMECKVFINKFSDSNPFISSVMGVEERFLLRFGDVSCDPNQLQLAGAKVGDKNYPMTTNMHFNTGQWYHIAIVYDGKDLTLYVNGKKEVSTTTGGGVVDLSWDYMEGFHIGRSERGRYLNGYISEARLWNKALTAAQLQDNVCYVDPTTEGLIAYWRFNGESQDKKVLDLTGHGHDAVASRPIKWIDGQKCPF